MSIHGWRGGVTYLPAGGGYLPRLEGTYLPADGRPTLVGGEGVLTFQLTGEVPILAGRGGGGVPTLDGSTPVKGEYPLARVATPSQGRYPHRVLAMRRWAVCLLHSRRRTFLLFMLKTRKASSLSECTSPKWVFICIEYRFILVSPRVNVTECWYQIQQELISGTAKNIVKNVKHMNSVEYDYY